MSYKTGKLGYGEVWDTSTENHLNAVYLRQSYDAWVIGGLEEVSALIKDLENIRYGLRAGTLDTFEPNFKR